MPPFMLKVLCSGDTAMNSFFRPSTNLYYKNYMQRVTEKKATIAYYPGKLLMRLLIKYIFNYSVRRSQTKIVLGIIYCRVSEQFKCNLQWRIVKQETIYAEMFTSVPKTAHRAVCNVMCSEMM